jgi:hypothetical protein
LIVNNLATLKELETYYSYEDALDLLEAAQINAYNQAIAAQGD